MSAKSGSFCARRLSCGPSKWPPNLKENDLIVLAPGVHADRNDRRLQDRLPALYRFIIVDLVIANVLMAMGLNQVQPTNIAIPFKLLLFVVMDGWSTLIHGLMLTYR